MKSLDRVREILTRGAVQILRTLRYPKRLRKLFNRGYAGQLIRSVTEQSEVGLDAPWVSHGEIHTRHYKTYAAYLSHQSSKLQHTDLEEYDNTFREALRKRLAETELEFRGKGVLCLAARIGTEVKSFRDHGAFAVGIDLNPGADNRLVLPGDFHNLEFADQCIDIVYTNSLDHALDLPKVIDEVRRVLKRDGSFIAEVVVGTQAGRAAGFYESSWWAGPDALRTLIEGQGLTLRSRTGFAYPWEGEQLIFGVPHPNTSPAGELRV